MECVDKRELEQFLQGKLEPERLIAVDAHLDACPVCKAAIEGTPVRARALASLAADLTGVSDCPDYEALSAFVDETLDPEQAKSVRAHANTCEPCTRDIERITELRSQAAMRETIRVSRGSSRRQSSGIPIWRKVLGAAVAACAVVAVVVAVQQPWNAKTASQVVGVVNPPASERAEPAAKPPADPKNTRVAAIPDSARPVKPKATLLLADGRYRLVREMDRVTLARVDGKSIRTELEARVARMIDEKIRTGKIKPVESVRVAMNTIHLRSSDEGYAPPSTAPKQVSPIGVVLATDRPAFGWASVDLAQSYRLVITDAGGNAVFEGTTDRTSLTLPKALERGRVYMWRVGARFSKSDPWANSRAAGFKVLSGEHVRAIRDVKHRLPGSHLALATVYESLGLYNDAASEYQALRRANPRSSLARRLLHSSASSR